MRAARTRLRLGLTNGKVDHPTRPQLQVSITVAILSRANLEYQPWATSRPSSTLAVPEPGEHTPHVSRRPMVHRPPKFSSRPSPSNVAWEFPFFQPSRKAVMFFCRREATVEIPASFRLVHPKVLIKLYRSISSCTTRSRRSSP